MLDEEYQIDHIQHNLLLATKFGGYWYLPGALMELLLILFIVVINPYAVTLTFSQMSITLYSEI